MVEERFGYAVCDSVLESANLSHGGAYTTVGTYPHEEMTRLLSALTLATGLTSKELLNAYGERLFARFVVLYPLMFAGPVGTFAFLSTVDRHIHVEVRKLHPEAELPQFEHEITGDVMRLQYRSRRPLGDLAEGLIRGCISHFGETIGIAREHDSGNGTAVVFVLQRSLPLQ